MPFSLRSRTTKPSKLPAGIAALSASHGGGQLEKGLYNKYIVYDFIQVSVSCDCHTLHLTRVYQ